MGLANNDAYQGTAEMENGVSVRILYMDAAEVRAIFGRQPKFGIRRKSPGWYWRPVDAEYYTGPFTSSRKAAKSAIEANRRSDR